MRSIEMSVTTTPSKSEVIKTKNVHLENKAAINTVSIYVAWSESPGAGAQDTDWKELKPGEMVFFSAERRSIIRVWAKTLSGTATLSITGSDASINKPAADATRLAWYDRSPTSKVDDFGGIYAPHAETSRISYTCPSNKKAMIEALDSIVRRQTVAGTPSYLGALWRFTPNGGSGKVIIAARLSPAENAVTDKDAVRLGSTITMYAGDVLDGRTYDISTTGTILYQLAYKITEFDA
jgi:hypothetical protein